MKKRIKKRRPSAITVSRDGSWTTTWIQYPNTAQYQVYDLTASNEDHVMTAIERYVETKGLVCINDYPEAFKVTIKPTNKVFWEEVLSVEIDKILSEHGGTREFTYINWDKKFVEFHIIPAPPVVNQILLGP